MAERFVHCWRDYFSEQATTDNVVIAEAALFQTVARVLLSQNLPAQSIDRCLLEISTAVRALDPILVLFGQTDCERHIRQLCEQRGDEWRAFLVRAATQNVYSRSRGYGDFAGMLQFMADYQERCEYWFE
jgi:hypothetical protein